MRASYPLTLLISIRAEHKTNLCLSTFSLCEFKDISTQWGKNIQGWSAVCLSKYSKQKASMCKQGGVPIISATERWNGRGGQEFKVIFVCSFCDHPGLHETIKQTKQNTNRCCVLVIYWASTACPHRVVCVISNHGNHVIWLIFPHNKWENWGLQVK